MSNRLAPGLATTVLLFGVFIPAVGEERLRFEGEARAPASPAAFVYDPIRGVSQPNAAAFRAGAEPRTLRTEIDANASFTVEAFARPDEELRTRPREWAPVFRSAGEGDFFVAGVRRSPPPHSYNWWQGRIAAAGQRPVDLARPRYKGISMVAGESPWRHVAFRWDADAREAAFFLDYRLQQSVQLESAPAWDVSSLMIGGGNGMQPFAGLIDEVRVTPKALEPWHFLRASATSLEQVSFAPEAEPALPPDYGHVDVRLHYGAVGDGVHDDTAAIRRAFAENENRVPIEYRTVYFPAGTYLISDSIRFSRFMVVRGAGPAKTVIQLRDKSPGYATPGEPKPAFAVGYDWPYVNRPRKNRAGNVIGNYIFDLSIDTGSGNPSVLGLDFHCNNVGAVENVEIRSGDGGGLVGLDLQRGWPGPCLIKQVAIRGFDVGIAAAHREYSLVFSDIRLRDQRVAGIVNRGNVLSLEKVDSQNAVPAVENEGGGLVVLLNSQLRGGRGDRPAIRSENASLYLRNVAVEGYRDSVVETRTAQGTPAETLARLKSRKIEEHFTGPSDSAFEQSSAGSLGLEIKDAPRLPRPPVSDWVNIRDYQDLVVDGDWAPAIEAAVAANKPLIYFPPDTTYQIKRDVVIRGAVRTFLGGSPKTRIDSDFDEENQTGPALVLADDLPQFQLDMLSVGHLVHRSPTTLICRHGRPATITAGPDCGELFIEDVGGPWRFNQHQRVWGRQLNPETKGVPEIINHGGQLWVLGLKTEYLSTKIVNRHGARTEILGGLMYPVHPVNDESLPMFLNEDADISLVHGVSVYKKNHKVYLRDTQQGETRDFTTWRWVNGRPIANLYRSARGQTGESRK